MTQFLQIASPCFRPLAGCGLFRIIAKLRAFVFWFPSPCGVWVVSQSSVHLNFECRFPSPCGVWVVSGTGQTVKRNMPRFPSPCGVWVVSRTAAIATGDRGFPSPCGCGLFQQVATITITIKVSVPLRGVGCFGKAAHSFWCNRKKNCQLCCFIVSYWQMFINSKLRNCKVPCEAHKTAT